MATIKDRYILEVDTRGATQSLNGFKTALGAIITAAAAQQVLSLTAKFEDLRNTLATVTGSVSEGAAAFDFISDFASKTAFGVDDLTQSFIKLKGAGIEPTEKIFRAFSDTASVTTDKLGTLQALTDLLSRTTSGGLGLEELERVADRVPGTFRIIEEQLGITRQEISEFGQTAEGARKIVEALLTGLDQTFGGATARNLDNLSVIMSNFRNQVTDTIVAFGDGISPAVKEIVKDLTDFLDRNEDIANSLGQISGEVLKIFANAIKSLAQAIDSLGTGGIRELLGNLMIGLGNFIDSFVAAIEVLAKAMAKVANTIIDIYALTQDAITLEVGVTREDRIAELKQQLESINEFEIATKFSSMGISGMIAGLAAARIAAANIKEEIALLEDENTTVFRKMNEDISLAGSGFDSLGQKMIEMGERIKQGGDEFENYPDAIQRIAAAQRRMNQEQETFLGTVEETGEALEKTASVKFFEKLLEDSQEAINQMTYAKEAAEGLQEGLAKGLYAPELFAEAMDRVNGILGVTDDSAKRAEDALRALNAAMDSSNAYMEDLNQSTEDAKFELEALNMTPLQRQIEQTSRDLKRNLNREVQNLNKALEEGADPAKIQAQIDAITNATTKAIQAQTDIAKQAYETQRSFTYGWEKAFDEYAENATNAATSAQRIFEKTTRGMEDAIVGFAKTGKFEFKDFLATIAEEILRSQVRILIAKLFGGVGLGGNSGFGTGNFAGFFANGGMIPGGQFGVVGEAGPELVSGPAQVTPLGGGGDTVIYNISAVDAPSFQQLIARDPKFIHAVSEKGRQTVSGGRR